VDYQGILRAALNLVTTGERGQGGSTITMQLARNFYLSSEKTYVRKLSEIFLALKIERELGKEKILELYLNKIYLGNRSYGVAAAAQVYYGTGLDQLSLPQIAMIAGLPKAPSRYNPIVNPERALTRRNYVLSRMHELDFISDEVYQQALQAPVSASLHLGNVEVHAPYINEMVRAEIVRQFGDEAYNRGLKVYTTVSDRLQRAANDSVWNGLVDYDQRHGFRGVIRHISIDTGAAPDALSGLLENDRDYGRFTPALVVSIATVKSPPAAPVAVDAGTTSVAPTQAEQRVNIVFRDGTSGSMGMPSLAWARKYVSVNRVGDEPKRVEDVLKPGDVIWVYRNSEGLWALGQVPEVQGALVSLSPNDGAIKALVGGFEFQYSKFNRVIQARRQAGSNFKPFIYTAALAKSYTPATLINDAPVVFEDAALEGDWRPENYSGRFYGPTRLRVALYKSRNLVSIRILRNIGIGYATKFVRKFGFDEAELPHDLSLALGSCEVSPMQLARGFSVFANGGYLITPYLISRIEDADGSLLFESDPPVACVSCVLNGRRVQKQLQAEGEDALAALPKQAEQTLEPRLNYLTTSILYDVIRRGTGRKALTLGRSDIAGKTGTTNDQRDAWFSGFNTDLVAVSWVGFDQLKPLGSRETGSKAALPIWIDYMRTALAGKPEKMLPRPEGLVTVKINAETGEAATDQDTDTVFEIFRSENAPVLDNNSQSVAPVTDGDKAPIPEQLF
jgi:penicillin-binding protein 1A